MISNAHQAAVALRSNLETVSESVALSIHGICIEVRSNSSEFLHQLAVYFSHVKVDNCQADYIIEAYDTPVLSLDMDWQDWAREPGKAGRKDAYVDLQDARLLLKVRTGMLFLQSDKTLIARGPCREQDNQVINFINSQIMNHLQRDGWLICHASALEVKQQGIGMAGLSGGGKSTLMLGMMDYENVRYVTNDRLFIRRDGEQVMARGIPKLPRINPGTIVHNPALHSLIDAQRREQLLALPTQELWHLEEKYDVMIDEVYGKQRILDETPLNYFLVLNWSHDSSEATRLDTVNLHQRRELLAAIMKSPGPFYQMSDGSFFRDTMQLNEQDYLDALDGVTMLEVRGCVDIPELQSLLYRFVSA